MVRFGFVLILAGSLSTIAWSQAPAGQGGAVIPVPGAGQPGTGLPPAAPPPSPQLLGHLAGWDSRMKEVKNLVTDVEKTETEPVMKRSMKKVGKIYCMKPNYAFMRLDRAPTEVPDPNDFVTYIADGKSIYDYSGMQKKMTEYKLNNPNGGLEGNLLLEFMSGSLTSTEAQRRFDLKILKEDDNYVYMEIIPRFARDKEDFGRMTVVFFSPRIKPELQHLRYLPAMVLTVSPDKQKEETWTFKNPQVNVQGLTPQTFQMQPPPANWRREVGGNVPNSGKTVGRP